MIRTLLLTIAFQAALISIAVAQQEPSSRVLIVVGPSNHPPGTHEVAAGARVVKHCLENAANLHRIKADILHQWPDDISTLDDVSTVVFTGDRFPPEEMPHSEQVMSDLSTLMDRGCGIVCIHYATGLGADHVASDGEHPLLRWLGGYFATRCPHHQSIARLFTATITPVETNHPVLRGWREFTLSDEPYINNYFGKEGVAENVTPLAVAMLPPDDPQREIVAWAVNRKDGGRGMGIVMPHYFRNWQVDDLRKCILNGIVWTAKRDVPADGVKSKLPDDLTHFAPGAVKPEQRH